MLCLDGRRGAILNPEKSPKITPLLSSRLSFYAKIIFHAIETKFTYFTPVETSSRFSFQKESGCDFILNPTNICYFTDIFEQYTSLLITQKKALFLGDSRSTEAIKKDLPRVYRIIEAPTFEHSRVVGIFFTHLAKIVKKEKIKRMNVEEHFLSLSQFRALKKAFRFITL